MAYSITYLLLICAAALNIWSCLIVTNASTTTIAQPDETDLDYWDDDDFVPYKGERHDEFDWKLIRAIFHDDTGNIIVSPFSIKFLLSLLAEAAGPDTSTHRELSQVLPSIQSANRARELYGKIFASLLENSTNYDLDLGSKIYVDNFIEPQQKFASIIESHYNTKIEQVDFSQPDAVADLVNAWCRSVTKDNIKQLVTRDDVEQSVMIMLNAIYFNGYWRRPFPTNGTLRMPFYKTPQKNINTEFMTQTANFFYAQSNDLNAQFLRIPYKGNKFAMTIILPNAKQNLSQLIDQFNATTLSHVQQQMDEVEVRVKLPKFRFDRTSVLNTVLENLGIRSIFTSEASLPALARGSQVKDRLRVSKILQKAGIYVNERGSTAYAASSILLANKFGGDMTREFNANRPFLFFIEDETTGTLLFAGKVTSPDSFMV